MCGCVDCSTNCPMDNYTDMRQLFVTEELAILARKYGFTESCLAWKHPNSTIIHIWNVGVTTPKQLEVSDNGYSNSNFHVACTLPTWQQLIDWFRVQHGITISIYGNTSCDPGLNFYSNTFISQGEDQDNWDNSSDEFYGVDYYDVLERTLLFHFTQID